ncbi:MAG: 6-bladed beta-propeller [Acidobacteria bacterium]|nr:6-bladed beta-propeller [Acidobacteriota bacterium]
MKKTLAVLMLLVLMIGLSCSRQKSGWQGTIEVVDGVTVVTNPNQGMWDTDEEPKVRLVQEKTIGMLDEGPDEYLFVYISDVTVNSKGDIYIADRQLNEIRKFDKDGNYLLTLGRAGQGPGEFQSVVRISVNDRDELLAFDNMMGRLSIFSDRGNLIQTTKKLVADLWLELKDIFQFENRVVIFGKLGDGLKLFHEFDTDWNYVDSFIDYPVVDNEEYEKISLGFSPGSCIVINKDNIYYCGHYFDNQIRVFNNNELVKVIKRQSPIKKPYKVEKFSNIEKARAVAKEKKYTFQTFYYGVSFVGNEYQTSNGLFQLTDGHMVNFVILSLEKEKYEFGVELYDSTGRLLSYSKLDDAYYGEIHCKDSDDCFYVVNRKDYNKVIKFRLEY